MACVGASGDVEMIRLYKDFPLYIPEQEEYGVLSYFNQPITEVQWPTSLLKVTFGESCD